MARLKVTDALRQDVYKDTVRIPYGYRVDSDGKTIQRASIIRIQNGDRFRFVVALGLRGNKPVIRMDTYTKSALGLADGSFVDTKDIRVATDNERSEWYRGATNPLVNLAAEAADRSERLASRSLYLGWLSFGLGVLSFGLGILAVWKE